MCSTEPHPDPEALVACARAAATAAAGHARKHERRRHEVTAARPHDVKLVLDVECQRVAEQVIRSRFPGHAILGEETPGAAGGPAPGYRWIVDPIDGTVNFAHGLPLWCSSVAVQLDDETLAGAVYAPALDVLFDARKGGGARRNGRPARVSRTARLARAIVATGVDKNPDPAGPPLRILTALALSAQKARVLGSAALDLCGVACGQLDGYFESGIYLWDVAAAGLIVTEAGGRAEIRRRLPGNRLQFAASNGLIHGELLGVLRATDPASLNGPRPADISPSSALRRPPA